MRYTFKVADQTEKLIQHLSEITDVHTHQIVAYVLSVYAIQYSLSGMNKWLHQQGFSLFLFGGECDFHILYSLT
jgi:transposase